MYLLIMITPPPFPLNEAQLDEPRYLLGTVATAAGITPNLLKSWVSRSPLVIPFNTNDIAGSGKGHARLFTLRRAINVAVTVELTKLGVKASVAGNVSRLITDTKISVEEVTDIEPVNLLLRDTGLLVFFNARNPLESLLFTTEEEPPESFLSHHSANSNDETKSAIMVRYGRIIHQTWQRLSDLAAEKPKKQTPPLQTADKT